MLDDVDRRILRQFQASPEASVAELAERCALTTASCWRRLEKLESSGVILGQEAIVDWQVLGFAVEVSLRVTLDKTQTTAFDEFINKARDVPEVLEIQTFLGRIDVRLSVIARDMAHYQDVYRTRILSLPHISDIEALMHVARIKSDEILPI
ncbi:Lrp/AsnC family transcriptional regulator [Lentibacter sp. XHP0401]|jgi:Lrp/AsnC family transcriptional regulator, cysteine-sensing transcriptional activator|uniref:Lrp/AsnC family transcriptional regulator n=1 Tax=Lentibacter sp. XHP0401 TaxID=2984334 RepID=UPI0021E6E6C1|nr:Lrp/AsnC family transcriptional regulator [Lentibacter sp. XHP0401]MCV2894595.1 Lrp/AsnC family transcriptional regulator [Lentibacter sp. XHP0401]